MYLIQNNDGKYLRISRQAFGIQVVFSSKRQSIVTFGTWEAAREMCWTISAYIPCKIVHVQDGVNPDPASDRAGQT
jgi:hypothetical protein